MSVSYGLFLVAWYIYYQKQTTYHVGKMKKIMKGGSIMRFHDVQDLTKTKKSERKDAAYTRMHDEFLEKLSVRYNNRKISVFGGTLTV